ncbi:MAG: alpha-mannosidase [Candidatus Didemnitutus sp.]|nr:alpha-mannosidase [Candidatus Didemnitutus sp.]
MPRGPHPFPQLIPNRVEATLRRLHEQIWRETRVLAVHGTPARAEHRSLAAARREPLRPVRAGEAWGRLFDQRWFRLVLPTTSTTAPRYLEWLDQGEATLWVDDAPYYGFDVAHRRVALPATAREAWIESYCCQTAIWHPDATGLSPRGSLFTSARLLARDEETWAAAMDLQAAFDVMLHLRAQEPSRPPAELARVGLQPPLTEATPLYRRLLRLLDQALDAHELRGLPALRRALAALFAELRTERTFAHAVLTGHAHIDLVWLWPERIGEAKTVHTFATVNRLMALYPEFRFASSQPAGHRALERRAPVLARAVAERVQRGQWQLTGALEVESDTQLPCGEALARSFLLGQEEFRRLRGTPSRLLWLPDVFGYSACLPQLMRLAGVEWFFTTKLTWSAVTRFPFSSFIWRGADGSEVVAHVTQNAGYNNRLDLGELRANAQGHVQSDVHPEFLHPTGFGDGGGGPTEEMCERARRLSRLAGTPALSWDHPEAFFSRLARRRAQLPVFQGECYLEYHRGTFTTHGDVKAAFRGLERALQVREAVAAAQGLAPDLRDTWRRLVFAQFHDYIPGSSVAEVYAEGVPELRRLAATQHRAAQAALTRGRGAWHVFNPLPQPWSGWVRRRHNTPAQWMELPPLASRPWSDRGTPPAPASLVGRTLSNALVRAEVDAHGELRALTVRGRRIALRGPAAVAMLCPDVPANYDAWDVDRHSLALGAPVRTPPQFVAEETGPERVVLAVSRALGRASRLTLRYILEAGAAVLRLEAEVDWRESQAWLKLHFPTDYRGQQARFGTPFGSVLRSQQPGAPAADAQWEVPASRWATVAHDGEREGLALVTEAKYGFAAHDGELTVSLLRAARITGTDDHRYAVPLGLSRHAPASPFSDQGRHLIRLALTAYDAGAPTAAQPAALADTLFTSPIAYRGAPVSAGLLAIEEAPTLVPAWAMPVEAGVWVLRLHEVSGQSGTARLRLAPGWRALRCHLDGRPAGRASAWRYRPYEIVSVRLEAPTRKERR